MNTLKVQNIVPPAASEFDMVQGDRLLTMSQVAELFSVSEKTLKKYLSQYPELEPITICGQQRWTSTAINTHVRKQQGIHSAECGLSV